MGNRFNSLAFLFDNVFYDFDNLNFHVYTVARRPKYCGRTVVNSSSGYTYFPLDEDYGKLTFSGIGGMDEDPRSGNMPLETQFPSEDDFKFEDGGAFEALESAGADLISAFADPFGPDLNLKSKSTLPYASKIKLVRYIPHVGFDRPINGDSENAKDRARVMYAPYVNRFMPKAQAEHGRDGIVSSPFDGFWRIMTMVPVGLPPRDTYGFLDSSADFAYMVTNRIFGLSNGLDADEGGTPFTLTALRAEDFNVMSVTNRTTAAPYPFESNIPSNSTFDAAMEHYRTNSFVESAAGHATSGYSGVPTIPFYIQMAFTYNAKQLTYPAFHESDSIYSVHPENTYLIQHLIDIDSDAHSATGYFLDMIEENYPDYSDYNKFVYQLETLKGGRLPPRGVFFKQAKDQVGGSRGEIHPFSLKYDKANPRAGANCTEYITHKMFYPRPYDGNTIAYNAGDGYFRNDTAVHNITDDPEGMPGSHPAWGPLTEVSQQHKDLAEQGTYMMKWGAAIDHTAQSRYNFAHLNYWGDHEISLSYGAFWMGTLVKKMMKGWNFDETPKQVQILAQPAQKLKSNLFSSISSPDEDLKDYVEIDAETRNIQSEELNGRLRAFGFVPNENDIDLIRRATGRDYSHRLPGHEFGGLGFDPYVLDGGTGVKFYAERDSRPLHDRQIKRLAQGGKLEDTRARGDTSSTGGLFRGDY